MASNREITWVEECSVVQGVFEQMVVRNEGFRL